MDRCRRTKRVWVGSQAAPGAAVTAIVLSFWGRPGGGVAVRRGERRPALAIAVAAPPPPSAPWSAASWNQHRKSSYLQKDCAWIRRLHALGHRRPNINRAVEDVRLEYSPLEIKEWTSGYDVVAMQEVDPLLRAALGPDLSADLIEGSPDIDGRGIRVDSTTALLLNPAGGLRAIRKEHAALNVPTRRGAAAARHHVAVLVRRELDGQMAVFCSVHLHPPGQIEQTGVRYLDYLAPLRRAIERAAMVPAVDGPLTAPCFLTGDFNVAPEEFVSRTGGSPFWSQLQPCAVAGGSTAHESNPSACGDFALFAGGVWHGRALGPPDLSAYERYADGITASADCRLCMDSTLPAFEQALASCKDASSVLRGAEMELQGHVTSGRGRPVQPLLDVSLASLRRRQNELDRERRRLLARGHRKGILSSDHRPLHFEGYVSPAAVDGTSEAAA